MQQLEQKTGEVYATIKSGDSFWRLAGTFKTTTAAIQALNPGVDPRKLQVGQKVRVV
ncbi:LysM peptidoglycan-binding domain-containing protein [Paenibacillus mucilaginosus]|nr:LysM peptidoglycan-binding domain-containing protein [Paenibacillus mucilaginosus]